MLFDTSGNNRGMYSIPLATLDLDKLNHDFYEKVKRVIASKGSAVEKFECPFSTDPIDDCPPLKDESHWGNCTKDPMSNKLKALDPSDLLEIEDEWWESPYARAGHAYLKAMPSDRKVIPWFY